MKANKITVVGAGFVGSATAFALMQAHVVSDIVLLDVNSEKAKGEAIDLNQGQVFVDPVTVRSGTYEDTADSDIVIITAGAAQKPGETRLDLVNRNIEIYHSLIPPLVAQSPNAILLVVSNPVDVLSYITYKLSGFPKERVIGSGTVLDTARFQSRVAQAVGVDPRNVHANIIGEHGDSEIATWSLATISGLTVDQFNQQMGLDFNETDKALIADEVKNAAYEIIASKGYTNYAVALAVTRIVKAILRDEKSILTVSSYQEGAYGLGDVYLSVPTIVGRKGIEGVIEVPYSSDEIEALHQSANVLKAMIQKSELF